VAERQRRHHTHAWSGHEASRRFVGLCQVADFVVEFALLPAYLLVNGQQWIDDGTKMVIFVRRLAIVPRVQSAFRSR